VTPAAIATALRGFAFRFSTEAELQQGVAAALAERGIDAQPEARISARDRLDFLCGTVGIETKIKGSAADLLRQCQRYLRSDALSGLVVVASELRLSGFPPTLVGKPVEVVTVMRGFA